jgi:hypothetical protein
MGRKIFLPVVVCLFLTFAARAQTAPSIVYDYYNAEAEATVAPLKFSVK